ncbi:MAG: hypothetical protein OEU94_07415 [Aquincola sp.]|nr:hypothetical protein [Aquincola sp.]MDH4289272.1 hypothetical protein [Aquincola sp.]MDH5330924.1 hypothetical protein [Aquincola sp.]
MAKFAGASAIDLGKALGASQSLTGETVGAVALTTVEPMAIAVARDFCDR